jgi:glyoxylase-like metal-dependent hydrolase (beta-lactamase superfamily II)
MKTNYFLKTFLMLLTTSVVNTSSFAQEAAYYRLKVGQIEVIALSDGTVPLDAEKLFHENDTEKIKQLLGAAYVNNPTETSINAYLIHTADRLILVDAGSGELFGPLHGGRLVSSLQAAGYKPEQITDVLLTHIHNDHSGGLTIKDQPVFPNAIVHLSKLDLDYWLDEKRMEKADPNVLSSNKSSFSNAIKVFRPYLASGRVKTFEGNVDLFPGIRTVAAPGHTPGHTLYILENNGDKLIFFGDLIHVSGVQFADPTIIDGFDVDKKEAIAQRVKFYGEAAQQGYLIAGDHVSFPGVGRLRSKGKGYEWMPIPYSLEGRTR